MFHACMHFEEELSKSAIDFKMVKQASDLLQ